MSDRQKVIVSFLSLLGLFLFLLLAYFYYPREQPKKPQEMLLIAHRGVHQTFPFDNVKNDTCTASIIDFPTHEYLENTIPSIEAAFNDGADMVEIDIHPTVDDQLAVFQDELIDCRTEGKGVTHEQSMQYLKTLDIGFGYTADKGKNFPFRGKGIGLMPTLDEVLLKFPDKKLAINQKDTFNRTVQLLADRLMQYPESQKNIYFFSGDAQYHLLKSQIPDVKKILPTGKEETNCIPDYLGMLFSGNISEDCKRYAIVIPARYLHFVPGWPNVALSKARQAGLKVYVTDVDSVDEYNGIKSLPVDGIVTNRIEIIGPLVKNLQQ
ncbi:MAG: glycerophosphodiester phosphodiesterase [Candidatus Levybacteria bacterium]|nr:glycerophosphodiester phosphodiesterase [Candidatus Levybacteria bacterium]